MNKKEHWNYYKRLLKCAAVEAECLHCKEAINISLHNYYTITKHVARYKHTILNLYFHENCFEEVAGESYSIESYDTSYDESVP